MITLEQVQNQPMIRSWIELGNDFIGNMGAIEHNYLHADFVARGSVQVMTSLGYSESEQRLAAIAGYLHDIGNLVNRYKHGMSGALMVMPILLEMGMPPDDVAVIMGAIGNHEEQSGGHPVNNVAAAVILADKSDVHHSRVRKRDLSQFTSRDRVNWAANDASLLVDKDAKSITMQLKIDTNLCSVMEYFEIFLTKMLMCKRAAEFLGCRFGLDINEVRLL
jgi:metal-dependent HD superfamily phosphatase/phosphodiesterase